MKITIPALCLAVTVFMLAGHAQAQSALDTTTIQAVHTPVWSAFDGKVQAVHQSMIAAQVSGRVVALSVRAGDTVQAGQVLLQIDAHSANQDVLAHQAQAQAAQATLNLASTDLERQRALYKAQYLSRAAFERAQAQYRTSLAQVQAQQAQSRAAQAYSNYFTVLAPYDGIVASLPVGLGDMAMPGQTLLELYDPSALRVEAVLPHSILSMPSPLHALWLELPSTPHGQHIIPTDTQILPAIDPATHTGRIRLGLPSNLSSIVPGAFARVWLPDSTRTEPRLFVPSHAIVRHAELIGLYVITPQGQPLLRQVRLGAQTNDLVEILSGVAAGERVALDPQAAAQWR